MTHADAVRDLLCHVVLGFEYRLGTGMTREEQLVDAMRAVKLPPCPVPVDVSPQPMQSEASCIRGIKATGWHGGAANHPDPGGES